MGNVSSRIDDGTPPPLPSSLAPPPSNLVVKQDQAGQSSDASELTEASKQSQAATKRPLVSDESLVNEAQVVPQAHASTEARVTGDRAAKHDKSASVTPDSKPSSRTSRTDDRHRSTKRSVQTHPRLKRNQRVAGEAANATLAGIRIEPAAGVGRRRAWRGSIAFMSSTIAHSLLLILLALVTLTIPSLEIWQVDGRVSDQGEEAVPLELSSNAEASGGAAGGAEVAFESPTIPIVGSQLPIGGGRLRAGVGAGSEPFRGPVSIVRGIPGELDHVVPFRRRGVGAESESSATFFGIQAPGQAFVFVVDSSNSMEGRRWERALYELKRSIENLESGQLFYVVFFDGWPHPMMSDRAADVRLRPANDEMRLRFERWLGTMSVGDFTRPMESMAIALSLRPDAIFLLSDGEFQDDTVGFLQANNPPALIRQQGGEAIPIHTICFESPSGQRTLQQIATEHQGTFRFVP